MEKMILVCRFKDCLPIVSYLLARIDNVSLIVMVIDIVRFDIVGKGLISVS